MRPGNYPTPAVPKGATDITGNRYGRLVVIGYANNDKYGTAIWQVVCDCGEKKLVSGHSLRRGATNSCGCLWRERRKKSWDKSRLPRGEAAFNAKFDQYKRGAAFTDRLFELTKKEFREIIQTPCHYCKNDSKIEKKMSSSNSKYKYVSGVDRIDNDKGYTTDNVVPCCWKCNKMKGIMDVSEFLEHVNKISIAQEGE